VWGWCNTARAGRLARTAGGASQRPDLDPIVVSIEAKLRRAGKGSASPTVVLVAGLKGSAEDWNISEKHAPTVFAEVAKFIRVCAYDRPGTPVGEKPSRSDPVRQPATAQDATSDLHALLSAAKQPAPLREW
jgi:pimeloyl-ACP methyl ester carboxylesterase